MNYKILLLGFIAASFASCTTAYNAGQTPDDVYYSPARDVVAKKEVEKDRYQDVASYEEDQYLRMKVRNRSRWATIDDYDYWYDSRYDYGYYNYNHYNNYGRNNWYVGYGRPMWTNYYFNGFHPGYGYYGYPVLINKGNVVKPTNVNRPSLGGYKNNTNYNNSNLGNTLRKVFTPSNSTYNNTNTNNTNTRSTYSTPSRTYDPPASSSSSSRSSSGSSGTSSGSVTRPTRGGN